MIEAAAAAAPAILWAVLAVWWVLSAVNQFPRLRLARVLRRRDRLSLLPRWTFFAPNPATTDLRLLWREEIRGAWQPWQELEMPFASNRWRWLFNPELVAHKALSDLSGSLLRTAVQIGEDPAMLSAPYIALLAIVMSLPAPDGGSAREFAIVRTSGVAGQRAVTVAFVSRAHAFQAASAPARVL